MAPPTYRQVSRSAQTSYFGMNEISFLPFSDRQRFHLTDGLNACFVLFLVSPSASLAAHLPPHPGGETKDPQAGDKNLVAKMTEFRDQYVRNRKYFDGFNVCLVFAVFHGKAVMQDKKAFIEKCLQKLKMDFPLQDYEIKAAGQPRRDEHGTAFVDGAALTGPTVYVEDRVAMRVSRSVLEATRAQRHSEHDHNNDPTASNPGAIFPRGTSTTGHDIVSDVSTQYASPLFPRATDRRNESPQVSASSHTGGHLTSQTGSEKKVESKGASKYGQYVKSKVVKGVKVVVVEGHEVPVRLDEWAERVENGRRILSCERYRLWTDL